MLIKSEYYIFSTKNNTRTQSYNLLQKLRVARVVTKLPCFMKTEGPLDCSTQASLIWNQRNLTHIFTPDFFKIHFHSTLPSLKWYPLFYASDSNAASPIADTSPGYRILLDFIALISGGECTLWNSPLGNSLPSPCYLFSLSSKYFSSWHSLCHKDFAIYLYIRMRLSKSCRYFGRNLLYDSSFY
jgi:hypothetical protein